MDELRRKRCESLLQQGYALIREGNLDAALEVGTSLEELRHSGGFEVAALALAGKGDLEAAVATLQRGVAAAPNVWLNWQLLGNYLSDLGRYQDAHEAYQRALSCPRRRADSIHLNLAILEGRRGRPLAALEALEAVRDPDLLDDVRSCRVWMLRDAGRPQEALALAESILQGEPPEDAQGADRWARIAGHAAAIRRSLGQDRLAARRWLYELLREAPPTTALFRALRDIDGRYSPAARRLDPGARVDRAPQPEEAGVRRLLHHLRGRGRYARAGSRAHPGARGAPRPRGPGELVHRAGEGPGARRRRAARREVAFRPQLLRAGRVTRPAAPSASAR